MRIQITLALVLLGTLAAFGQKKEKIEYYTDSDVSRNWFGMGVHYNPYFSDRRVVEGSLDPTGAAIAYLNSSADGLYGQSIGFDLYFDFSDRFEIVAGADWVQGAWNYDVVQILGGIEGVDPDTGRLYEMDVRYETFNVPIQFVIKSQISDMWQLEVAPMIEVAFLNRYDVKLFAKDGTTADVDLKPYSRDVNFNVGLSLGGTWWLTDQWGFFAKGNFRYALRPYMQEDIFFQEIPYLIGGNLGFRYQF